MSETTYRLDVMHPGLRLVVLLVTLAGAGLGILVITPALARLLDITDFLAILFTLLGGSAIGIGAGWAAERYLPGIWPSGRWLKVDDEGMTLRMQSHETVSIRWAEPVDVRSWHFVIRTGRRWIPRGWFCVACRLAQHDKVITPYTFMKPIDARALAQWAAFPELISRKQSAGREADHQVQQAGGQEPLWMAERDRWNDGAEMTPGDFATLVAEIDRRAAHWLGY